MNYVKSGVCRGRALSRSVAKGACVIGRTVSSAGGSGGICLSWNDSDAGARSCGATPQKVRATPSSREPQRHTPFGEPPTPATGRRQHLLRRGRRSYQVGRARPSVESFRLKEAAGRRWEDE